jgi:LemA protein
MFSGLTALAVALGISGLSLVRLYNRLVALRNATDNAFRTIDVQMKQRWDLIPNLVQAVRGYMTYEQSTLERLVALRQQASAPGLPRTDRVALDAQMAGLLQGVVARVEAYPELKASEQVLQLQRSLNEAEAQLAAARRTYNAAVTTYNTRIQSIPANLVAGALGFESRPLFEATSDERAVPSVGALHS